MMRMVSSAFNPPASTIDAQAVVNGTPIPAACSKLRFAGRGATNCAGAQRYWAWAPSRVMPSPGPVPHTGRLASVLRLMMTPEKSRPGVRGSVVCSKSPATFLGSLGFMAAALTSTSSSPDAGVGVGTSSISSTDGGPKWWNLKALICAPVRTTLHSKDRRLSLKAISSRVRELSGTVECGPNVPAGANDTLGGPSQSSRRHCSIVRGFGRRTVEPLGHYQ